jgi:hypothetical protein
VSTGAFSNWERGFAIPIDRHQVALAEIYHMRVVDVREAVNLSVKLATAVDVCRKLERAAAAGSSVATVRKQTYAVTDLSKWQIEMALQQSAALEFQVRIFAASTQKAQEAAGKKTNGGVGQGQRPLTLNQGVVHHHDLVGVATG